LSARHRDHPRAAQRRRSGNRAAAPATGGEGGNYKIYAARTPSQQQAIAVYERVHDVGAAIEPAVSYH